jgi:hypothetical protein
MAWTTFPTLIDGQIWTGAHTQLVRDNFAETAPAKATTAGAIFAVTATNTIAQRVPTVATQNGVETTTSTTYTSTLSGGAPTLGPTMTLTTGPKALVIVACRQSNSTAGVNSWTSYAVTGASSVTASDNYALSYDSPVATSTNYHSYVTVEPNLVAGSNIFTMQYRASANTATFSVRRLSVIPF